MKKALLSLLILSAFLSVDQIVNAAVSDTNKEAGYISLNASTVKELEPNLATVTFAVENTASDAQKASQENNEVSNKIINALKQVTSTQTDTIKTTNFSVRPVYSSTSTGKRVIKNYMAVNSVTVETKDITKVAKLIDTAIASGANRTDNLYYSVTNEKSVCNTIYPELVKDLRTQALSLAQAAGTTLDGLKHMNVSCNTDSIVSNGRFLSSKAYAVTEDAAAGISAPTPVESGKVKIRVYINADFYVK